MIVYIATASAVARPEKLKGKKNLSINPKPKKPSSHCINEI
jgi:hypothetical protein